MFEIMAINQSELMKFYANVFGWKARKSKEGFDYIEFPIPPKALLGGMGTAKPGVPGWGKGITFYLQCADLKATLVKIEDHGGKTIVEPVKADGYTFAMFEDPECNLLGLIEPF